MTEYTSLEISKRLKEVGFKKVGDRCGPCDAVWFDEGIRATLSESECMTRSFEKGQVLPNGSVVDWYEYAAYRSDSLIAWLLHRGDSLSIEPDLDGINITFWKDHLEYDGLETDLPDALAEVVLKVLEVSE